MKKYIFLLFVTLFATIFFFAKNKKHFDASAQLSSEEISDTEHLSLTNVASTEAIEAPAVGLQTENLTQNNEVNNQDVTTHTMESDVASALELEKKEAANVPDLNEVMEQFKYLSKDDLKVQSDMFLHEIEVNKMVERANAGTLTPEEKKYFSELMVKNTAFRILIMQKEGEG